MSGAGGSLETHNQFSLEGWCESRGEEVQSLTWGVHGDAESVELPRELRRFSPVLVEFDAEQKRLIINHDFCRAFGVRVENIDSQHVHLLGPLGNE